MVRTALGVLLVTTSLAPAPRQAQAVVAPGDAGAHIGKTKIVCGDVSAVRRDGDDSVLELAVPPSGRAFAIVVASKARRAFVPTFETAAPRWNACARGKIEEKPEGLRIKIDDELMLRAIERSPVGRAGFAEGVPAAGAAGIVRPQPGRSPKPKYTAHAMKAKLKGDVELEGVLGTDGRIGEVRVIRSLDALFGLDGEAMKAFKEWRFTPATRDGQPVAVVVTVVMTFSLH